MKITIKHPEAKARRQTAHYVHCRIEFSQEEQAIIRERTLRENVFAFATGQVDRPPHTYEMIGNGTLLALGFLAFILALGLITAGNNPIGTLILFVSLGIFIYRWVRQRNILDKFTNTIPLKNVLEQKSFTVSAVGSPTVADDIEAEVRHELLALKALFTRGAVYPETDTFEL